MESRARDWPVLPPKSRSFRLNGVTVIPTEMTLSRNGTSVRLEPKVMRLLVALCANIDILVSRGNLIDLIWRENLGSDESLTRLVYQLRQAFKSFPDLDGTLRTVSTAGYKLEASLESATPDHFETLNRPGRAGTTSPANSMFTDLSIAVLHFADYDSLPENRYLEDGMCRDLTRMLATSPMLRVAPHSSVAALQSQALPLGELGAALNCRFLLSGSFHRQGHNIRLRFELTDMPHENLAWSGKYSARLDEFFEVQNDVLLNVTTAISTQVQFTIPAMEVPDRTFSNDVYRIIQNAETLRYSYGPEAAREIVSLLRTGLEIDPGNALLEAALAVQLSQNVVSQWEEDPTATRQQALALTRSALQSEPRNPEVTAAAGIVNTMFHRPDIAIAHLRHATANDPNNPHARAVLGWQICLRHDDPAGIELIATAERQAPHHPRFGLWATYRGTALLFMLDYQAAVAACEEAVVRTPGYYQPQLSLAWAHAGLGRDAAALRAIRAAVTYEGPSIVSKFVGEMKKWSGNSPNAAASARALDRLVELQKSPD